MKRRKFKLSHSIFGTLALIAVEAIGISLSPENAAACILIGAVIGAAGNIYVATEIIEEVRNAQHMLILLCVAVSEFIVFFAFQYAFLEIAAPESFPTLNPDAMSLLLHSTMIFVFNPLYLPTTSSGRVLLLINTIAALGLVLFILQNIWQFRHQNTASS